MGMLVLHEIIRYINEQNIMIATLWFLPLNESLPVMTIGSGVQGTCQPPTA